MELPEDAHTKPPEGYYALLGALFSKSKPETDRGWKYF